MQGPFHAVVAEWPRRLNQAAAALRAAPSGIGATPFVVGGGIAATVVGGVIFFSSGQGDNQVVIAAPDVPIVAATEGQGPSLIEQPVTMPAPCRVDLFLQEVRAITEQQYPYEGIFVFQSFDQLGMPLPGVVMDLQAHKADGAVTTLTTAPTDDKGETKVRVRAPAGQNEQQITGAQNTAGNGCFIPDNAMNFIWNPSGIVPALIPPIPVPDPVPAQPVVKVGVSTGCDHTQPGVYSNFRTLWLVTNPQGAPVPGATVEASASGAGILEPNASGVTNNSGTSELTHKINQYGPKTAKLEKVTLHDGTAAMIDPASPITATYNVGQTCTPP